MKLTKLFGRPSLVVCLLSAGPLLNPASAQTTEAPAKYPDFPSETPAKLVPATSSFDYDKRDVMIPMRDGVKLHTVIVVPKGAKNAPILLTRTPYSASAQTSHAASSHLGPILNGYDNVTDVIVEDGYIRVVQDIRGKYGSEGDYVMTRPLHGPLNPTPVDHSTDTYDTIDWLVKNIPESNGKVGILGISYDGFLPLMALVNPHPALKVAVPMNPMVDGWKGDDWFHNGAFREQNMPYIYEQEATRANDASMVEEHVRRLRHVHARRVRGRTGPPTWTRTGGLLAEDSAASELRCLLAAAGNGPDPGRPTIESADHDCGWSMGPGGHLWGDSAVQSHQAEGYRRMTKCFWCSGRGFTVSKSATAVHWGG